MEPRFVHLHVHSEYSLVDSVARIKPLLAAAAAHSPAIALTDRSNLFAAVKFYRAAMANGVKPILGVDAWLRDEDPAEPPSRLLLLCQSDAGYRNLCELISLSYQRGQRQGRAEIDRQWFAGRSEGLIALSGGRDGDVGRALLAGRRERAMQLAADWMALFPDRYYLELCRTGREGEQAHIAAAVELARNMRCPLVASNEVRFIEASDFHAHEARVCIGEGRTLGDPRRPRNYSEQQYLRSPDEMCALFADLPEALENTVEIARRCNVTLRLGEPVLPDFPIPAGMTEEQFFVDSCRKGLEWRLERIFERDAADFAERRKPYDERLQIELDVILQMGFPGYFLIVADFIQWSKDNGIPVGPGRGSGAGSLVAYSLQITDLDPIEYDLLFERFLNPERVSMPDFDVDFCMDGRDRVIAYVADKYGHEKVSQIITYGSMAAKAVVRDVGRVMDHPYGFVDRIAKLVPFEVGMTLNKALAEAEDLKQLYDDDEEVREVIDLALELEGLARNAGKHAGGVVIAPSGLTDFCPLYCEEDGGGLVTQFDKDDAEAIGLVKFDFLGLRTLTIIDNALKTINALRPRDPLNIDDIPLDDAATFRLLKKAGTTAVFQLESRGMKELIKRLLPDCFEDIIALVALFRPGPLQSGMVDDFISRKHGQSPLAWPHPDYQLDSLKPVLEPTYGIILYQEQVMQIAQVMGGYSLGGADLLRRAMGKKKPEEMAKQRAVFLEGCANNGIDADLAGNIFDLVEKFAGYGFNKSHSAAYALVSYQTAWLKTHHPAAFMAAVLSADMDNTDKVVTLIDECQHMQLAVVPPDINRSVVHFTAQDGATIVYGLGAIKGVGDAALESLIAERDGGGHFRDLDDFCRRADGGKVGRRVIEALICAGALDQLGANRATLTARLADALRAAEQQRASRDSGQVDLFGGGDEGVIFETTSHIAAIAEWPERERLRREKEVLGLYLTGHPIDEHLAELAHITDGRIQTQCEKVDPEPSQQKGRRRGVPATVAGLCIGLRTRHGNSGKMGFATLDDRSGRVEVVIGPELLEASGGVLGADRVLIAEGELRYDDFSGGHALRARALYDLDTARAKHARAVSVRLDGGNGAGQRFVERFDEAGAAFRDELGLPVFLHYSNDSARARIELGGEWRLRPESELIERLERIAGKGRVRVVY